MPEPSNTLREPLLSNSDPHAFPGDALSVDDALIETYLDGELSAADALRFEGRLEGDAELAEELAFARRVRDGLRELPRMSCPAPVTQAVLDHAEAHPPLGERVGRWLSSLLQRPAIPALVAFGLVAAIALPHLDAPFFTPSSSPQIAPVPSPGAPTTTSAAANVADPSPAPAFTADEVARAEQDIKLALAYLGRLGSTADRSVRQLTVGKWAEGLPTGGREPASSGGQEP